MNRNTRMAVGAGAVLLVVAAVGVGLRGRTGPASATAPADTIDLGNTPESLLLPQRTRGASAAPLVIFEFSDFQCPYCRDFWEQTLPAIEREYIRTGKARLTFVNFPIRDRHPNALAAHRFAMCAARQEQFWPYHDLLFRYQTSWAKLANPTDYFRALADSARLDQSGLTTCLAAKTTEWLIEGDVQAAWNAGVQSTPTFVVNGGLLAGTAPFAAFKPILDSIYRAVQAGKTGR
ncbi:MAG: DsbA family protein [Gemmatimonadetes bacterium]|nr:DsbA family protein [Gemmatimonadota bacterium]